MWAVRNKIVQILTSKYRIEDTAVEIFLDEHFISPSPTLENTKLRGDLLGLFTFLKSRGVKIAICTTDDEKPTRQLLELFKLSPFIDVLLTGDMKQVAAKPSKEQIDYICNKVGVNSPEKVIMVGDTATDLLMGRNGGVKLNIGMLDGASSIEDLRHYADVLVDDLDKLKTLLQVVLRAD